MKTKSSHRRDKLFIAASTMPICVKGADGRTRTLDSNEGPSSRCSSRSRDAQGLTAINKRLPNVDGAFIITILPPAIIGIGNAGGFKMLKDKKDLGPAALEAAAQELAAVANADLRLSGVYTPFTSTKLDARREIEPRRGAVAASAQRAGTTAEDQAGPVWRSDRAAR